MMPQLGPPAALALMLTLAACASGPEPDAGSAAAEPAATASTQEAAPAPQKKVTRESVKPSHPVRYTVKRGDTLWDIAAKFLRDPWVWPEIWSVNPQIENPHLIYPGDVITLAWVGGEPRLRVSRPGVQPTGDNVEKLEPQVRERPLDEAIASIPGDAIRQFLNRPRVVTREQLDSAPYILGTYEGHLISAAGNDVFARGFPNNRPQAQRYAVVRPGEPLVDPATEETLGYEAIHVGRAAVRDAGPPARLELTDSTREILRGDRLLPADSQPSRPRYVPKTPGRRVSGDIIKLFDAISQVGTNQIVIMNLGRREDMEVGTVLGVEQSGGTIADPYAQDNEVEYVDLPPQRVGTVMIFRVFDRVSYGLVLKATRPIQVHDTVTNP